MPFSTYSHNGDIQITMTLDKRKEEPDEPEIIDCDKCNGEGSWDTGLNYTDYQECEYCEGKGKVYDM